MRWPPAKSASSWWPAARARGWASKGPRAPSPSGPSPRPACSRSTPRRSSHSDRRYGRHHPALHHDQPRKPRSDDRFLRAARPLRPGARPLLRPGADAGRRSVDRQGAPGRQGPGRPLAGRPRRDPRRPGRPGPGGERRAAWTRCASSGVRTLFYFQVDNPLVRIAEPAFIGLHREAEAEMSFKVVERLSPEEKLGVVVIGRRPAPGDRVFRPSRLSWPSAACPRERSSSGPAASPFTSWSGRSSSGSRASISLPFHRAIKKVPYRRRPTGRSSSRIEPNAVKFEQFIFDAPAAGRAVDDRRDRPGWRVRAAQERRGPRLAGDRPPADERPVRQLAGAGRRDRSAPPRRLGPVRHRDQPAVRSRRHRAEVEDRTRNGRRAADLPAIS